MKYGKSLLHALRFFLRIDEAETQVTASEHETLLIHARGSRLAAELGVFEGATTAWIAKVMAPDGQLYGVDPFFTGRFGLSYGLLITQVGLRRMRLTNRVKLIRKLSFDAAKEVPDALDFVFVDGDHRYQAIERDWQDWSAKLRLGGVIALHDTHCLPGIPAEHMHGSVHFFREAIAQDPRFELIAQVDSLNVLRRVA